MTQYYHDCCKDLGWQADQSLVLKMKNENEKKLKVTLVYLKFLFYSRKILKELDGKIEDAEKNLGESEIREANLLKAEYLSLIGEKVGIYLKLERERESISIFF